MSLQYKLVLRDNLQKDAPVGSKLYYAQTKSTGVVDFKRLVKKISRSCTVTGTDIKAVLDALIEEMKDELSEGKILKLDGFGSFRITFGSVGIQTEKEFKSTHIRRPRYTFTPSMELKEQTLLFKYKKYVPEGKAGNNDEEEDEGEPNPFPDNV